MKVRGVLLKANSFSGRGTAYSEECLRDMANQKSFITFNHGEAIVKMEAPPEIALEISKGHVGGASLSTKKA